MQTARTPQVNRGRRWVFGVALAPLALLAGCQTATQTGALAGGAGGAVLGNIIGKAAGNRTAGTILGGGIGAIAGAATGNAVDEGEKRAEARANARYQAQQPLGHAPRVHEIADLARAGTHDQVIINQIRATNARYNLTSQDLIFLQQNGVSSTVISEMQATGGRPQFRGVSAATVYEVEPVPVYCPPPPPVHGVSIGYQFGGGRRCR